MKISALNLNFGNAFTTKQKKAYACDLKAAREVLGTDKTSATVFDFSVPYAKYNTGIGTTFSNEGVKLGKSLKELDGINVIQMGPQGDISNLVRSPYSGTCFSLGRQLIDLEKLEQDDYGNLLTKKDFKAPFFHREVSEEYVDYENIFSPDGQDAILKTAYSRFRDLDKTSPLKKEFENFKKENTYWLERDALFEAAAIENGTRDIREWSDRDQNIFSTTQGDRERISQLKQVCDDEGNNVVDYEEFVQFIADKQQKEAKAAYNKQGQEIYGDSPIGVSQKDFWAHKSAFSKTYEFGCDIGNNNYSCWTPAIDFDKLDGEAGEFLFQKFNLNFKRYDGLRIDAAWQYINPLLCEPRKNPDGSEIFDASKNKLGNKLKEQPKVKDDGKYILNNIILKAADKNGVSHDKILLELLGGNSNDSLDAVKGSGTTLIHITRYASPTWGRVKFYESKGDGSNKYQNMKPGDYIIGPGTHDDYSLIEQAEKSKDRIPYLSQDLKINPNEIENAENLSQAIIAELYTTNNQFITLPDILGSDRRINTPNTSDGNWEYRAKKDYEKERYENLSRGKGVNTPDVIAKALKAKNGPQYLIDKMHYYADILRRNDGPMTTKEADKLNFDA